MKSPSLEILRTSLDDLRPAVGNCFNKVLISRGPFQLLRFFETKKFLQSALRIRKANISSGNKNKRK